MDEQVIPVLYVEDAARAVAWYGRLGFHKQWEHQFEAGFPWFVSVVRGRVRIYLSEHQGDARPNALIHLNVAEIDAVAQDSGSPSTRRASPDESATSKTRTATGPESRLPAPDC